jgi:hypothetical protein
MRRASAGGFSLNSTEGKAAAAWHTPSFMINPANCGSGTMGARKINLGGYVKNAILR